jgi:NAD(P)-dependent dehydrogenase (short-subunit alcohol dehydrogenase family)
LSGISFAGLLDKANASDIASVLEANLLNPIVYTSAFLNSAQDDEGGRVILASSILAARGQAGVSPYAATKGGVEAFARAAAHDAARRRITINALRLGYFDVGMIENVPPDVREEVIRSTPVRALGCARDLTRTVEFLLDPNSGFITGATIPLTGGL